MNATGVHYSDDDLRALLAVPGHDVLVASLADRFGAARRDRRRPAGDGAARPWHLKLLPTSCRVVSFGRRRAS